MSIIQVRGTQCCGKSTATACFKNDDRVAFYDVLKFYERKGCIKEDGMMDWDKWNQAMTELPSEIRQFIKETANCKVQIVEHGCNRVVAQTLSNYDTTVLEMKVPSEKEIIRRAKGRKLDPVRVAEFREAYIKKYACHPNDALTEHETRMAVKAKLSGIRVGVIGTAGRKEDAPKMTKEVYKAMVNDAKWQLERLKLQPHEVTLVSGGAAWSDHVAVSLFLLGLAQGLNLHFPAAFNIHSSMGPGPNNSYFFGGRTADTANYYHEEMSKKLGGSTLNGLSNAIVQGAKVKVTPGFKERDKQIGQQAEVLLAYTWGLGDSPKPMTGTAFTWKQSTAHVKIHVPLNTLS